MSKTKKGFEQKVDKKTGKIIEILKNGEVTVCHAFSPETLERLKTAVDLAERGVGTREICSKLGITAAQFYRDLCVKGREELKKRYDAAIKPAPVKLDDQANKVIMMLHNGLSAKEACRNADLSLGQFYTWTRIHDDNLFAYHEAIDQRTTNVVDALYKTALEGNVSAQIFWLKNRDPKRWKDSSEVKNSGTLMLASKEENETELFVRENEDAREKLKEIFRAKKKFIEERLYS